MVVGRALSHISAKVIFDQLSLGLPTRRFLGSLGLIFERCNVEMRMGSSGSALMTCAMNFCDLTLTNLENKVTWRNLLRAFFFLSFRSRGVGEV